MNTTPTRDEVLKEIQNLTTTLLMVPSERVQPTSRLREDLEADSLFMTQLVLTLEDNFGIETDETDGENFSTIDNIADYVMEKLEKN